MNGPHTELLGFTSNLVVLYSFSLILCDVGIFACKFSHISSSLRETLSFMPIEEMGLYFLRKVLFP